MGNIKKIYIFIFSLPIFLIFLKEDKWKFVFLTTVFLVFILSWDKKLKKEIYETTQELKKANKDLLMQKVETHNLFYYDKITHLPNRSYFIEALKAGIKESKSYNVDLAILFIDLDQFKQINDNFGHDTGDSVLKKVSNRLKKTLKGKGVISRAGGDEFFVLLKNIKNNEYIIGVTEEILKVMKKPVITDKYEFYISLSIGVSIYNGIKDDYKSIMKNADIAMYRAKEKGGNTYQIYYEGLNQDEIENLMLANNLRNAIKKNELSLYYQPKIDVITGKVIGMEALLRWHLNKKNVISPNKFIPIAEETGLIIPIGEWVIREACRFNKELIDSGYPAFRVSVNISPKQFKDKNLISIVEDILNETNLSGECLELEITENLDILEIKDTIDIIENLKELGIYISIDDFGKGYSSLNYLKDMSIDELKIDKSFILGLSSSPKNEAIAKSIILLAHQLDMKVTAEGVEKLEDLMFLKNNQCDKVQGFYYSEPLTRDNFISFIKNNIKKLG